MLRTRVGYAGGASPSPTYRNMGDHTEVLQVDFDPVAISYASLLEEFWREHRPVRPPYKRQYRSVILFTDDLQRQLAVASRETAAAKLGQAVFTEVEPLRSFTRAEDYHQKYHLRHDPQLMRAVRDLSGQAFVDSTLTARLNAQAAGYSAVKLAPALAALR